MDVAAEINKCLAILHALCGALPHDDPRLSSFSHVTTVLRAALKKKVPSAEEKAAAERLAAFQKWRAAAPKVLVGKLEMVDPLYEIRNPPPSLT